MRSASGTCRALCTSSYQNDALCRVATGFGSKKAFCQRRATTSACMNAAMLFERADEVVLPAVYRFVARSFNATPSQVWLRHWLLCSVRYVQLRCKRREANSWIVPQLGYITLARSLMQALSSPLGGFLGAQPVNAAHHTLSLLFALYVESCRR